MSTAKSLPILAAIGVLCVASASPVSGQIFGRRLTIKPNSYRVTIVSHFDQPVTIGLFGRQSDATFRVQFDGGRSAYRAELIKGERMVCVWDASGSLLFAADLYVDSSGTLDVGDIAMDGPVGKGAAAKSPPHMPTLRIRP